MQDKITKILSFPESQARAHQYLISLARENMTRAFKNRLKQQGQVSVIKLEVGDLVLLRVRHLSNALDRVTKKFFHLYEGPYKIIRKVGDNAFVLADPSNNLDEKGTYNRWNLRKYYERSS